MSLSGQNFTNHVQTNFNFNLIIDPISIIKYYAYICYKHMYEIDQTTFRSFSTFKMEKLYRINSTFLETNKDGLVLFSDTHLIFF